MLALFKKKPFSSLFTVQALGVLNDNLLRNALAVMVTFQGILLFGMDPKTLVAAASGLLIVPFLLFSPLAGELADKMERSFLVRATKWFELVIMIIVGVGFYLGIYELLVFCLFLTGTQSTLFGPLKYSLLPDILTNEDLTAGNGLIGLGTFISILIGTIAGGLAVSHPGQTWVIIALTIGTSVVGVIFSYLMPQMPAHVKEKAIQWNPIPQTWELLKLAGKDQAIFYAMIAVSWFWFFGSITLSILPEFVKITIGGNESVATAFLACFTLGIGVGSILASLLSNQRVEMGIVPFGALGLSVFLFDLNLASMAWAAPQQVLSFSGFLAQPGSWRIMIDFFLISVSGGIYFVPLNTFIQQTAPPECRSRIVAANNIMNAFAMVFAAVFLMVAYSLGFSLYDIFIIVAIINILVSFIIYLKIPELTLRFLAWSLLHFLYRLKKTGRENIPKEGPAVLVCNHVTFVDWLVIYGTIKRPIRFVMYYKFYEVPFVKRILKQAQTIPICSAKEDPEILNQAFEQIDEAIKNGWLVLIFPEGTLSPDGELSEFRPGVTNIVAKNPVPIIPMALKGMYGSMFGKKTNIVKARAKRGFWAPIELNIGQPLDPKTSLDEIKKQVSALLDN